MADYASMKEYDLLKSAIESGILDITAVQNEMQKKHREKYLAMHKHSIWAASDGRFKTRVYDESKPNKRRLVTRNTREKLDDFLVSFYSGEFGSHTNKDITLMSLYPIWLSQRIQDSDKVNDLDSVERDWKLFYSGRHISEILLKHLTKEDIDKWATKMIRESNLCRDDYYKVTRILRLALDFAVEKKLIECSPLRKEITLRELYPEWLEFKELHTNAQNYIWRIGNDWDKYYSRSGLIDVPIRNYKKIDLEEWAHRLVKEHDLSKKQYYNMAIILRQALDYAVDKEFIEHNPFSRVKIDGRRMFRRIPKPKSETQVFSRDEVNQIEAFAWNDFLSKRQYKWVLSPLALIFQFQTGLRSGELVSIKHSDIDGNILHIERMYRRHTDEVVDRAKTPDGIREIILTEKAKEIVRFAKEFQLEKGVFSENEYVFTSVPGTVLSPNSVEDLYRKYCKYMQTQEKSSHKSRKTYISSLYDAGVNINTIRELVGHKDEKTTLQCYVFDRTNVEERKAKIESALNC